MKKKLSMFALAGLLFSLSGCYTSICPTYAIYPDKAQPKKQELKTDQSEKEVLLPERPS